MRRRIAAVLAITNGFNGLANGPLWHASVPGASDTGLDNPHFVLDIGLGRLAGRPTTPRFVRLALSARVPHRGQNVSASLTALILAASIVSRVRPSHVCSTVSDTTSRTPMNFSQKSM
jgi:hypothetical protein